MVFGMPNAGQSDSLRAAPLRVCNARDCAVKHRRAVERLEASARSAGLGVEHIGCQGNCAGPTAVVLVDGEHRWFEKLRSRRARTDLIALATGELPAPTATLAARELTDERRAAAARKLGVA